jgi:hypothetical protein
MFSQKPNGRRGFEDYAGRPFGLWAKGLWPYAEYFFPHLGWIEIIWCNTKYTGKTEKLLIGNVAKTDFDLAQSGTAEFQLAARFPYLRTPTISRMYLSGAGFPIPTSLASAARIFASSIFCAKPLLNCC